MSRVLFIKSLEEMDSFSKWGEVQFEDKDRIIDENALPVGEDYQGRRYKLVAKKVRLFSKREMAFRKVFAGLSLLFSFGSIYLSRRFRKYIKRNKTGIRFALLIDVGRNNFGHASPSVNKKKSVIKHVKTEADIKQEEELPPILSLQINAEKHALNKPLARKYFLSEEFLNTSLVDFLKVMDCSSTNVAIKAMSTRLENFDQAMQLKKRLESIRHCELILGDFIPAWKESFLKFGLISDKEFPLLTLTIIGHVDPEFVERVLRKRLIDLAEKHKEKLDSTIVSPKHIQGISLIHLYQLGAKRINEWMTHLPPLAFCLFSDSVIQDLQIKHMSTEQIEMFFISESRVHMLTSIQINNCVNNIPPRLFSRLKDEQILALHFVHIKNEEIFAAIFNQSERSDALLRALSSCQINEIRKFLSVEDWRKFTEDQILGLDYSLMKQTDFDAIFNGPKIPKLFRKLSDLQINYVKKYFTDRHWDYLAKDQIIQLDFSEIDQDVLKRFFSKTLGYDLIKSLSTHQIYHAYPHFYTGHWKQLTPKQIIYFDFSKHEIDQKAFESIFSRESEEKWNLLEKLSIQSINALIPYFTEGDWGKLSLGVLSQLDYTKIDSAIFYEIFSAQNSNFEKKIQVLPIEKLYQLIPFFLEGHWTALSDQQVLAFDYSKLTKESFDKMWPESSLRTRRLLPQLPSEAFHLAKPFLDGEHIKMLTDKQKRWLEINKNKENVFEPIAK